MIIFILFQFITILTFSQNITGKVINTKNGEPLEFVSIGVHNKPIGTITNEKGNFELDISDLSHETDVIFSMIGYNTQLITINKLINNNNIIKLEEKPIQLSEVIVLPTGRLRKVGTTKSTFYGGVCGWGGTQFGKGHEIGTEMELGLLPVYLKSLHLRLYKQSFDSTLLRLHIRTLSDNMPDIELLTDNIIISVSQESGWLDIDLSQYNIVLSGRIVLSLEWVKVYGVNKDKLMRMNKSKNYTANVLFKIKTNKGSMFTRWGSEAKWARIDTRSPSFYLTIQE